MPLTSTTRPFGLREITVVPLPSGTAVKLPAAQTLSFSEALISGELRGDDATQAIAAYLDKVEWELESGGISFEALKVMTGRAITLTGTTPSQVNTVLAAAGSTYPYFKIYGKIINDDGSDIHVLLHKCKLTEGLEGEFADGEFYIQGCSGIAVSDGTKIYSLVHNETTTAVPTT
jgi:2',3'-cyclic-nucleotide 2'-phosphodiesterase (5'-nucleotidase family)